MLRLLFGFGFDVWVFGAWWLLASFVRGLVGCVWVGVGCGFAFLRWFCRRLVSGFLRLLLWVREFWVFGALSAVQLVVVWVFSWV